MPDEILPDPLTGAVPVSGPPTDADLASDATFDHADPAVHAFALDAVGDASDETERARRLFATVRDHIRYDPYASDFSPSAFRASAVVAAPAAWCVPKSILLTATARAVGIPARIGFADVRNHLSTPRLLELMGSDVFVFHGYATLYVGGAWRKASTAFNAELCARFGVEPLEFDGRSDALLHAFDGEGRQHMEYLEDRGTWTAVPLTAMQAEFHKVYGNAFEQLGGTSDPAVAPAAQQGRALSRTGRPAGPRRARRAR